jgi:hypothetical protein
LRQGKNEQEENFFSFFLIKSYQKSRLGNLIDPNANHILIFFSRLLRFTSPRKFTNVSSIGSLIRMPRPFERLFQSLKVDRTSILNLRYETCIMNVTPKISQQ